MKKGQNKIEHSELKFKINNFLSCASVMSTPAHAANFIGVHLVTLKNYRSDMEHYNNELYNDENNDLSYKALVEHLYTVMETRILDWWNEEPTKRTTIACAILNKHFGYRDGEENKGGQFTGTLKIELSPEIRKMAQ